MSISAVEQVPCEYCQKLTSPFIMFCELHWTMLPKHLKRKSQSFYKNKEVIQELVDWLKRQDEALALLESDEPWRYL